MFWGMNLKGPKSHVAFMSDDPIRISNIALETSEGQLRERSKEYTSFYIVNNKGQEFLVAQLRNPERLQVTVDLDIEPEDDIMFRVKGSGTIYLSGYVLYDDEDSFSGSEASSACHKAANNLAGLRLAPTQSGMPPPNFG